MHTLYLRTSFQRACHLPPLLSPSQQPYLFPSPCHGCLRAWPVGHGSWQPSKCCGEAQQGTWAMQDSTETAVLESREVTFYLWRQSPLPVPLFLPSAWALQHRRRGNLAQAPQKIFPQMHEETKTRRADQVQLCFLQPLSLITSLLKSYDWNPFPSLLFLHYNCL